jgi:hypothetical protein
MELEANRLRPTPGWARSVAAVGGDWLLRAGVVDRRETCRPACGQSRYARSGPWRIRPARGKCAHDDTDIGVLRGEFAHPSLHGLIRRAGFDLYRSEERATWTSAHALRHDRPRLRAYSTCCRRPGALTIFAAISFITSISRSRSAARRFSRPFSVSRTFRRSASDTSIAPNHFRHLYTVGLAYPCFLATSASGTDINAAQSVNAPGLLGDTEGGCVCIRPSGKFHRAPGVGERNCNATNANSMNNELPDVPIR